MKTALRIILIAFFFIVAACNQQKGPVRKVARNNYIPINFKGHKIPADSLQPPSFLIGMSLQPPVTAQLGSPKVLPGVGVPQFNSYNPEQWLQTGNLLCGFCDSKGNLWVGSSGRGLTRFDGKTATNFNKANGLANNTVKCIAEDKAGNIWAGTVDGLSKYDGRSFTSVPTANNNITCLLADKSGSMWVGTFKGLLKIDSPKATVITTGQGLPSDVITALAQDKSGNLWVGTGSGGACQYDGATFSVYNTEKGLASNIVRSLAADSRGNIWVGTFGGGVSLINGSNITSYSLAEGLPGNKVGAINIDRLGKVWIGTNNGLCSYNGKVFQSYPAVANEVKSICADIDGAMWFVGAGDINMYNAPALHFFPNVQKGLTRCGVKAMAEDAQHQLWMGTDGDGLNRYDGTHIQNYSLPQGLADSFVNCVLVDKKGNIWIGTTLAGIAKINGKSLARFTTAQGLVYDEVNCMAEDAAGNIWIGTENGLSRFDGKAFQNYGREQGLPDVHIRCLYADAAGHVWVGTRKGLCLIDGASVTLFTTSEGLAGNEVNYITADVKSNYFIGTNNGLSCATIDATLKPSQPFSRIVNYSSANGLPDNNITQLLLLPDGTLMAGFATKVGLAAFQPLQPLSEGGRLAQLQLLNTGNGFPVRGLNANPGPGCLLLDTAGMVWAGITDPAFGLLQLDTRMYTANKKQARQNIIIDKIKINWQEVCWYLLSPQANTDSAVLEQQVTGTYGKPLSDDERDSVRLTLAGITISGVSPFYTVPQNLILPYTDNNVTIGFNSISASRSGGVAYSYMLAGYDTGWSPAMKQQEATFGNIREGDYTFKVRALNADGSWSEPVSYTFTVMPPWYRLRVAYGAYLLLLLGGIIILFRWRTAALKRKQRELERTVEERTAEIVQKNKVVEQQKAEIVKEKELTEQAFRRSEELLLNILPAEVAEELKQKGVAEARHYDEVTVLFTDFTNFTKAGERMTARELVGELDNCFKAFDNICDKYHIEKIKTVGDAYLAVCGLPGQNTRHARNVVMAAREIRDFMAVRKQQLGDRTFGVRIGINSGPVVAGIVGIRKFAYDIWGDTVNTAARMEQNSEGGKINISQSTYDLVKDTITCTYRGEIEAKGKGQLKMYYVE